MSVVFSETRGGDGGADAVSVGLLLLLVLLLLVVGNIACSATGPVMYLV